MSGKSSYVAGGIVIVLVIAGVVFLLGREGRKVGPPAEGTPAVVGGATPEAQKPPAFEAEGAEAQNIVPTGGEVQTPVVTPSSSTGDGNLPPVVARGRVSWLGGTLPDDVDVTLYDNEGSDIDMTTAATDGSFELRWGEPLALGWSVGTDSVAVLLNGMTVSLAPDNIGNLPLHLPGEPPIEVNLVLGFPPVISGRVYDRTTGQPIEAAEITAVSTLAAWTLDECFTLSAADGSYTLELEDVPLRELIVWCRDDEWQAQMTGPQDLVPAKAPGEGLHLDFPLERPTVWHGRITSAADGLPVGDATITVGNDVAAFSDYFDFEISDEDGRFELDLPDVPVESAWVHVSANAFAPAVLRGVKPGDDLSVTMGLPVTLAGMVVVHGTGIPVEGADVQIFFDGETIWGDNGLYDEDFTGKDGTFEVLLESAPLDAAKVKVAADGFAPYEMKLQDVAKAAGPGQQTAKIELQPVD